MQKYFSCLSCYEEYLYDVSEIGPKIFICGYCGEKNDPDWQIGGAYPLGMTESLSRLKTLGKDVVLIAKGSDYDLCKALSSREGQQFHQLSLDLIQGVEFIEPFVREGKELFLQRQNLMESPHFLPEKQISKSFLELKKLKEKVQSLEKAIEYSSEAHKEMNKIETQQKYLNEQQLNLLVQLTKQVREKTAHIKTMTTTEKGTVKAFNDELACNICLELPEKEIYSCTQHHLLCHSCFDGKGLQFCPTCRQSFVLFVPTRNSIAERMVKKLRAPMQ